jgi:TPP-dependent indolepyruvate ferredoxin oxidoreductase alpha subunit
MAASTASSQDPRRFRHAPDGLNIRLGDQALAKEARLHDHKRAAILAFARASKPDRLVTSGGRSRKIGIITCGKSYLDVRAAMDELGIDEVRQPAGPAPLQGRHDLAARAAGRSEDSPKAST